MEIPKLFTAFLLLLISLLNLASTPSQAALIPARNQIRGPKSTASGRNPSRVDCVEIGSRSECSQNTKCRWCRSDALDDMCFSKSEAWRLPSQHGNSVVCGDFPSWNT